MLVPFIPERDLIIAWNENLDRCIGEYGDKDGILESWRLPTDLNENPFYYKDWGNIDGICVGHLSFHNVINDLTKYKIKERWHSFCPSSLEELRSWKNKRKIRDNYGVCDDYKQILKEYPELEKDNNRKFMVSMTPIFRDCQPKTDGWRWHKWGKYIGKQKPKSEYLYDEVHIDLVWVYNIYEVEEKNK